MHTEQGIAAVQEEAAVVIDAADHLGLAGFVVKRYARWARTKGIDVEELEGEAYLALVRAAQWFQPEKGFAFSSYAIFCMRGAVYDRIKRWKKLTQEAERDNETGWRAADVPARPEPESCQTMDVQTLLPCLTDREGQVIRLLFGLDGPAQSDAEVAELLGISRSRVGQLSRSGLNRMRRAAGVPLELEPEPLPEDSREPAACA
jgi:RNA polymerase sigma factor (sigma-70 family)